MYRGVQGCTGVSRDVQGCTGVSLLRDVVSCSAVVGTDSSGSHLGLRPKDIPTARANLLPGRHISWGR